MHEVDLFPLDEELALEADAMVMTLEPCDKMSLCGTVEQRESIIFRAHDNLERPNATMTALMHVGNGNVDLPVTKIPNDNYSYEFKFSHGQAEVVILEVFMDGVQIPESPVRVQIASRDCEADFPGQLKIAVSGKQRRCLRLVSNPCLARQTIN